MNPLLLDKHLPEPVCIVLLRKHWIEVSIYEKVWKLILKNFQQCPTYDVQLARLRHSLASMRFTKEMSIIILREFAQAGYLVPVSNNAYRLKEEVVRWNSKKS